MATCNVTLATATDLAFGPFPCTGLFLSSLSRLDVRDPAASLSLSLSLSLAGKRRTDTKPLARERPPLVHTFWTQPQVFCGGLASALPSFPLKGTVSLCFALGMGHRQSLHPAQIRAAPSIILIGWTWPGCASASMVKAEMACALGRVSLPLSLSLSLSFLFLSNGRQCNWKLSE